MRNIFNDAPLETPAKDAIASSSLIREESLKNYKHFSLFTQISRFRDVEYWIDLFLQSKLDLTYFYKVN